MMRRPPEGSYLTNDLPGQWSGFVFMDECEQLFYDDLHFYYSNSQGALFV